MNEIVQFAGSAMKLPEICGTPMSIEFSVLTTLSQVEDEIRKEFP